MPSEQDPRPDEMKQEMIDHFAGFEADYRESDWCEIVYEDDDVVVVADHAGHEINDWATDFDVERGELSAYFHRVAESFCDYSWEVSDPIVFEKE